MLDINTFILLYADDSADDSLLLAENMNGLPWILDRLYDACGVWIWKLMYHRAGNCSWQRKMEWQIMSYTENSRKLQ